MFTSKTLKKICPALSAEKSVELSTAILKKREEYKFNDDKSFCFFLANLAHESGQFSIKEEDLFYRKPERIVAIWPSRFYFGKEVKGKLDAVHYIRSPFSLAKVVYGGRMGNDTNNDGYTFRGGGYAQITGREAYQAYFDYIKKRETVLFTLADFAKKIQTEESWAIDSAFWFFCVFKKLEGVQEFKTVVKKWNGGLIGMKERLAMLAKTKAAFNV